MHISITGLKPKGLYGFIKFWILAIPSFGEAKSAKGNLFKGPFHLPRQEWLCYQLLNQHLESLNK
jgi:hypothetical protein